MQAFKKMAALSVLSVASVTAVQASVISPSTPTGSEVLLTLVSVATGDSLSQDLGKTISQLQVGDSFALSSEAQQFITNNGGLGGVEYGIVAGSTQNFVTKTFLTSSLVDLTAKNVANATKGTWENSIIQLVNNLNAGDASGPEVNNTYGPFDDAIGSPNYLTGGHFNWQTGDPQLSTLASGEEQMALYQYNLSGFGGFTTADAVLAPVQLTEASLSIVPVPAAVWLFGSALMGMFGAARRQKIGAAVAALKDRLALRTVDLI